MNRRDFLRGVAVTAVAVSLPAIVSLPAVAEPVPVGAGRPFSVMTSRGLYVATEPGRWAHPPEVQRALAENSVIWGALSAGPGNYTDFWEMRCDVGNGWTCVTRQAGPLSHRVFVKGGKQWGAQIEERAPHYRRGVEAARTNLLRNSSSAYAIGPFA